MDGLLSPVIPSLLPRAVLEACKAPSVPPSVARRSLDAHLTGGQDDARSEVTASERWEKPEPTAANAPKTIPCYGNSVGAICILDLSGYTSLTEMLFARSAGTGGELLYRTVNPFFQSLIDTIHTYGGDIIKFCGDSIIAAWTQKPREDESEEVPIRHDLISTVLACAGQLLTEYDDYEVNLPLPNDKGARAAPKDSQGSIYKMGLHIGIGFGAVIHVFTGKVEETRAEYLIIGRAIEEASWMLQQTRRGQIAVCAAMWEAFRTGADGRFDETASTNIYMINKASRALQTITAIKNWSLDAVSPSVGISVDCPVECFVDESGVFRLTKLQPEALKSTAWQSSLNELRRITTVFIRILGFSLNGNVRRAVGLIQLIFNTVWSPLRTYKGRLRQVVFDDKGLTFMLVWGLPPSNSMDEVLALFCAIAIKEALRQHANLEFSIGISRGNAFTGIIGNTKRADFNLFGKSINMAARCMGLPAATGEILCDLASIEKRTIESGGFTFGDVMEEHVKGVAGTLQVACLIAGTKDPLRLRLENPVLKPPNPRERILSLQNLQNLPGEMLEGVIVGRNEELQFVTEYAEEWLRDLRAQDSKARKSTKGLVIFGKSGCGKTSLGKFCEGVLLQNEMDSSPLIFHGDCFEIARHTDFYLIKMLVLQILDSLIPRKTQIKNCQAEIRAHLEQHFPESLFHHPTSRRNDSSRQLIKLRDNNSSLGSLMGKRIAPSLGGASSRSSFSEGMAHIKKSSSLEMAQVLECLGFSKALGSVPVAEELLAFLGLSAAEDNLSHNPTSVRTAILRILSISSKVLKVPSIFVFDNVQWADPWSFNVLVRLLQSDFNIFAIILSRPMEEVAAYNLATDFTELLQLSNVATVDLAVMDYKGVSAMLRKNLGGMEPHPSLINEILNNSGGIPMVIEILATGLRASKMLWVSEGMARLTEGAKLTADDNDLGGMMSAQFDRLPTVSQAILTVAAITGITFSLSHIVQVCNDLQAEGLFPSLPGAITVAEATRLLQDQCVYEFLLPQRETRNEDICHFRHIYIQTGLKSMVLTDVRVRIHLQLFLYFDLNVRGSDALLKRFELPVAHIRDEQFAFSVGKLLFEAKSHLEHCHDLLRIKLQATPGVEYPELLEKATRLEYLLMESDYFFEKQLLSDAKGAMTKAIAMWRSVDQEVKTAKIKNAEAQGLSSLVNMQPRLSLYANLSTVYLEMCDYKMVRECASEGLKLINFEHAEDSKQVMKVIVRCALKISRAYSAMRKYLRRLRKRNKTMVIELNFQDISVLNEAIDIIIVNLCWGCLFTNDPLCGISASLQSIERAGNLLQRPLTIRLMTQYVHTENLRITSCGSHTATSIHMMVLQFAQAYIDQWAPFPLDAFPMYNNFPSERELKAELSRIGKGAEGGEGFAVPGRVMPSRRRAVGGEGGGGPGKVALDERKLLQVQFNLRGAPPKVFSLDGAEMLWIIGYSCRTRDYFEMEERYLRLAAMVMFEMKRENSHLNIKVFAFYRELMYFAGACKIAHLFLEPLLLGTFEPREYKAYLPTDACLFALSHLDLEAARSWESNYWHLVGDTPPFTLDASGLVQSIEKKYGRVAPAPIGGEDAAPWMELRPGEKTVKLPSFLERDAMVPLMMLMTLRTGFEIEDLVEGCRRRVEGWIRGTSHVETVGRPSRWESGAAGGARETFVTPLARTAREIAALASSLDAVHHTRGRELERFLNLFHPAVVAAKQLSFNLRYAIFFRAITLWLLWSLYSAAKVRWVCARALGCAGVLGPRGARPAGGGNAGPAGVEGEEASLAVLANALARISSLDPFRVALKKSLAVQWSRFGLEFARKSGTYMVTVMEPTHQGAAALADEVGQRGFLGFRERMAVDESTATAAGLDRSVRWHALAWFQKAARKAGSGGNGVGAPVPRFNKAKQLWECAVEVLDSLEDGKPLRYSSPIGEFREPVEWRGIRFWGFQKELMKQRAILLDAADVLLGSGVLEVALLGGKVARGRTGRVAPEGEAASQVHERLKAIAADLEWVSQRLVAYGGALATMDVRVTSLMLAFVREVLDVIERE
ncbi:Adenylate cyclase type 10 [Phlyctochytrium bullatum]|nr:Adenylate cyclase type 10 [Phlyctochytrium bullatum]